MSKKILIIEGLVVAAILAFSWFANRDSAPVGAAAPIAPAATGSGHVTGPAQGGNTVDLERPPFLDEVN